MPGKWAYIGGGAALLCAGIIASRSDLRFRSSDEASPPPVAATAPAATPTPEAPAPAPVAAALAPAGGELVRLIAELARREAENAELRTTLAVRDAVIESLPAELGKRERSVDDLEARLAASDAEIAALREELAALGAARTLEAKLALFEPPEDGPSAARVEAVRADAPVREAVFEAGGPPAVPLLPPSATGPRIEVFFDFASSRLSPGGQANAAVAAVTLADMPLASVRVIGHTDRVGSPGANRRLAARRARAVADFLVEAGLPAHMIEIDGMGEAELPVPTGDGIPEPMNRIVAIVPVPRPIS
jgi:outer membrane protein OmpA-like peptidoglycan-associated protein